MNTAERQALRQVVRQRMKVLRSDVVARKAELEAEVAERVTAKYATRDKLITDLNDVIAGIWDQARKDVRVVLDKAKADHPDMGIKYSVDRAVTADNTDKHHMGRQLNAEIEAQVAAALSQIDRQEADLIEEITVDGLETEAAKNFLARIPTVGQLVPAARMREITS